MYTVGGTVSDISPPEDGSSVVSWPPPVPPNGDILYYNVRITVADTGELVKFVEMLTETSIDIAEFGGETGVEYHVEVL